MVMGEDFMRAMLSRRNQQRVTRLQADLEGEDLERFDQYLRVAIQSGKLAVFSLIFIERHVSPEERERCLCLLGQHLGEFGKLLPLVAKAIRMRNEHLREVLNALERWREREAGIDWQLLEQVHLAA